MVGTALMGRTLRRKEISALTPSAEQAPAIIDAETPVAPVGASQEAIRERAYQIYLARGETPGDAISDWLQAEVEIRESCGRRSGMT